MGKEGKRRNPYRFTIYVPEDKELTVKQFIKLFRGPRESASSKLIDFMEKQVKLQDPNWQKRLTNYVQGMGVLCGCGQKATYRVRFLNQTADVCIACRGDLKRKYGRVGWRRLKP